MYDPLITDEFDPRVDEESYILSSALQHGISGRSDIVSRYEGALADHFGMNAAISVSSGFGALVVGLSALGLKPGDKVLVTPTCPLCTVYALTFMGLIPLFCDTQPDNFGMDLSHADRLFDHDVAAIIEIPMWGYPLPADETQAFAEAKGVPLIMDIALAHKAQLNGKYLAEYGDLATFSTHWSKNFVTAEGGCVLTNNLDLAEKARNFSYPNDPHVAAPSLNYSMGGLQAALGLARLSRLDQDITKRRENMRLISEALESSFIEPLPIVLGGETGGTKLLLREKSWDNTALLEHMDDLNVPSDILNYRCKALYEFPVLEQYRTECTNAEALLAAITTVPVQPDLTHRQLEHIVKSLNTYTPPTNLKGVDRAYG